MSSALPGLVRVGTRGSALATAQTSQIMSALRQAHPELQIETVIIRTSGDEGSPTAEARTKTGFTRELEDALLEDRIDLAVHSCKDLAAILPEGLCVGAVPQRASVADVLITHQGEERQPCARVMTSSARRRCLVRHLASGGDGFFSDDVELLPMRGNIDTRLRKLREAGAGHGLILAAAGLQRLAPELDGLQVRELPPRSFIPAPGQGALLLQCRENDAPLRAALAAVNDEPSALAVTAERLLIGRLGLGCGVPFGALASVEDDRLHIQAIRFFDEQPARMVEDTCRIADMEACVAQLADALRP